MRLLLLEPFENFDSTNESLSPIDPCDLFFLWVLQVTCKDPKQASFRTKENLTILTAARLLLQFELVSHKAAYACLHNTGGIFLWRVKQCARSRAQHGQSKRRIGQSEWPCWPPSDARLSSNVFGSSERNPSQTDRWVEVSVIRAKRKGKGKP